MHTVTKAAYGVLIEVKSHPYALDEMTFMDWRDGHLNEDAFPTKDTEPSFLYTMPFSSTYAKNKNKLAHDY